MKSKKTASILKKFLLFNLTTFSILGLFTIFYLKAIQPNLVKKRAINHKIIINNTVDHLERLNVDYSSNGIRTFLLSTRFLFQSLDRVQFYDSNGELIGDTNILVDRGIIDYNKDEIEVFGNFYLYQETNILSGKDLKGDTDLQNFTANKVSFIYDDDIRNVT